MPIPIPARLLRCGDDGDSDSGVADMNGRQVPVNLMLVPEATPGDWVLRHAGFAIQKIEEADVEAIRADVEGAMPILESRVTLN